MTIGKFKSDEELVDFAKKFLANRVGSFRKDINICLAADANKHHAYFPALITCIGFADPMSGLYAEKLEGHSTAELTAYAKNL